MAQARFLDQVPIGVYQPQGSGGNCCVDIYQNGILVSSSIPYINISGSATVSSFSPPGNFDNDGVTIFVQGVGFPFSGSAAITGSLIISGSSPTPIIFISSSVYFSKMIGS